MTVSNRDNKRAPIQFRRESQPPYLKKSFFLKNRPIHYQINSTNAFRLVKRNWLSFSSIEINKPLPALVLSVSHRSDWSSKVNSNGCQRSDAWSHLEWRVVSSAQIVILQRSSGRSSLMYSWKSLQPRMNPWGTPALTGYSCEVFHPEPPKEIRRNKAKYLSWNSVKFKFAKKTRMPNSAESLGYIKCYRLSSPRLVKSPSNSIRHKSEVDREDLKPHWKSEKRSHFPRW